MNENDIVIYKYWGTHPGQPAFVNKMQDPRTVELKEVYYSSSSTSPGFRGMLGRGSLGGGHNGGWLCSTQKIQAAMPSIQRGE